MDIFVTSVSKYQLHNHTYRHMVKSFHIKIKKISFCHNSSVKVNNPHPTPKRHVDVKRGNLSMDVTPSRSWMWDLKCQTFTRFFVIDIDHNQIFIFFSLSFRVKFVFQNANFFGSLGRFIVTKPNLCELFMGGCFMIEVK